MFWTTHSPTIVRTTWIEFWIPFSLRSTRPKLYCTLWQLIFPFKIFPNCLNPILSMRCQDIGPIRQIWESPKPQWSRIICSAPSSMRGKGGLTQQVLTKHRVSLDRGWRLCITNISPELEFKGNGLSFSSRRGPFCKLWVFIYDYSFSTSWILKQNLNFKYPDLLSIMC